MRIIVATAPGGGFDTCTRIVTRHPGRHIPGNPTIIVENMPGAGHRIGANYVYKVAKPDGLTPSATSREASFSPTCSS